MTGRLKSRIVGIVLAGFAAIGAIVLLTPSSSQSISFDCEGGFAGPFPCENVNLESTISLPELGGATGNDLWGWTHEASGREFVMVGTTFATGFVEVTDPTNPRRLGVLPTAGSDLTGVLWRDIKVDGHYAFIVSEIFGSGMQVFDLRRLLDVDDPQIFDADAHYDEVSNTHNIWINRQTDFAYLLGSGLDSDPTCGANGRTGGPHMVDISDPLNPTFAGCARVPAAPAGEFQASNYAHDLECIVYDGPDADYTGREICFGSNENAVVVYDVTDKANPEVISIATYPEAEYTHQGSLTANRRWFLFGDELDEMNGTVDNTTTWILDVSDLDNLGNPVAFSHETLSIDHNLYVHEDKVLESNYNAGLRILEYDDASLASGELTEVGYFDVVPGVDAPEFAGTWSNFLFPKSGTIVISTIENELAGLMVLSSPLLAPEPDPGDSGTPRCAGEKATIVGTNGGDVLEGTAGPDVIVAKRGDDRVRALDGDDVVCGGAGEDVINGGGGDDKLIGGKDGDKVKGKSGGDRVVSGGGDDTVNAGGGGDLVRAGAGRDVVRGGTGDDELRGGARKDVIHGGKGADRVTGFAGHDALVGGAHADHVAGGPGADELKGNAGDDRLKGGDGPDTLAGGPHTDTCSGGRGRDTLSSCES